MSSAPPPPPPSDSGPYGQQPPYPPPYSQSWDGAYPPPPAMGAGSLADWWQRLVATLIDGVILSVPFWVIAGFTGGIFKVETDAITGEVTRFESGPAFAFTGLSLILTVLYSAWLEGGEHGATVGKMAMKIKVRDLDTGGPIGPVRAGLRRFIYNLLFYACIIPGIINGLSPLWDARRQAWHDKAVNSIVVKSN